MGNNNNNNENNGIDFTSNSIFKKVIRKSKWKQILLYIFVSIITLVVSSIFVYSGSEYLTNKKIAKEDAKNALLLDQHYQKGASISSNVSYHHNLFSVVGKKTYYKQIGDRKIVWDTETKKFPAIGNVEVIDRGSGFVQMHTFNEQANRYVRYNQFNNERFIDFYYPGLSYDFLPQELEIAVELDESLLIEVAISFNEPKSLEELGKELGYKNVNWLWVDQTKKKSLKDMEKNLNGDSLKVKTGENAHGYSVSEDFPYDDNGTVKDEISGAVISGTPEELERFLKLELIRTSVLGATIDKF